MGTAPKTCPSYERILLAATELFAMHGYEGVTTRQIAANTGLNISTIHHHVGPKRELYLRVIEGLYAKEERLIDSVLSEMSDTVVQDRARFRAALDALVDGLLDFAQENPARQRLYVRRWIDPVDELQRREAELTLRLYRRLSRVLRRGQATGVVRRQVDIGYFLRTADWMIFCYFTAGAFSWSSLRAAPGDRKNLSRFKAHLREYTQKMLEN